MAPVREWKTVGEVGEFGLLARMLPALPSGRGVVVGPGDDAAVVKAAGPLFLFTTDALVEGVHFRRGWMTPRQIGRKAYLVNASDIAAMGGRPRFCVASTGAPADLSAHALCAVHEGVAAAAQETGAVLVGGNLARADALFVSVALLGEAARPVTRSGARPGDLLFVTGTVGEAALGLRALIRNARARGPAVARFREPAPRLQAAGVLARAGVVSAMIDVSDGLLQDLRHLCEASGVGAEIEIDRVPRPRSGCALSLQALLAGGEDYELLCAVPERHVPRVKSLLPRLGCPLTCIGRATAKAGRVCVRTANGEIVTVDEGGFDHFAQGKYS